VQWGLAVIALGADSVEETWKQRFPGMTQRSAVLPVSRTSFTEALGEWIAVGNSREPPVFTFVGRARDKGNIASS
jgi:hypothetical protein